MHEEEGAYEDLIDEKEGGEEGGSQRQLSYRLLRVTEADVEGIAVDNEGEEVEESEDAGLSKRSVSVMAGGWVGRSE